MLTSSESASASNPVKTFVAVKSLHVTDDAESVHGRDMMLSEAALMAQFKHENVVQLIGVVTVGEPIYIILEFCENGAMDGFLQSNTIENAEMERFAIESANGMKYLCSLRFIHRDLASRNVLLATGLKCKIADFGMSRAAVNSDYYRSHGDLIAVRWTAPEALEEQKFSEQSDVWSFGVLMWEIWSRADVPYKGMGNDKVWANVLGGYRLPCPDNCPPNIYSLMLACWGVSGTRPTFTVIVETLSGKKFSKNSSLQAGSLLYTIPDKQPGLIYTTPDLSDDVLKDDKILVSSNIHGNSTDRYRQVHDSCIVQSAGESGNGRPKSETEVDYKIKAESDPLSTLDCLSCLALIDGISILVLLLFCLLGKMYESLI